MLLGRCSVVYSEIGCVDQGYTLAQVVLKRLEVQKNTYLCFVDLNKAYDSVWREVLLGG